MEPLYINHRKMHLLKPFKNANYKSKTILTNSAWEYVDLYMKRTPNSKNALVYWNQAKNFYYASLQLPNNSKPLTAYYCCLNAAKALATLVNGELGEVAHGVRNSRVEKRKTLDKIEITFMQREDGVMRILSNYFREAQTVQVFSLKRALYNIPCVHRAYSLTYGNFSEIFIPVSNIHFLKDDNAGKMYLCFHIDEHFSYKRIKKTIPDAFEVIGETGNKAYIVQEKNGHRYTTGDINAQYGQLQEYHNSIRPFFDYIFGDARLWYLKKKPQNQEFIDRTSTTIIFAVMHWFSELVRYSTIVFEQYLNAKENFLLNEFIETALHQFIDAISCEITHEEIMTAGYRK